MEKIRNISCFHRQMESKYFSERYSEWVFHGLADQNWKLVPAAAKERLGRKDGSLVEKKMLGEFKRRAGRWIDWKPQNDFEWLALGQHHGLPTRLLDWSLNPYIALYFVVFKHHNRDGKFVALRAPTKIPEITLRRDSPFNYKKELGKYLGRPITRRIAAQDACFTVHRHVDRELDNEYLAETRDDWCLNEYVIPSKAKQSVQYYLFRMGIHQESLFPGEDGLSNHLYWKYAQANPVRFAEHAEEG